MAHPVTRLTAGTTTKNPGEGRGGMPRVSVDEICAACGTLSDPLEYWAVMAYVLDQHPKNDDWPMLLLELQNQVVVAWNRTRYPKSMRLESVHGVAMSAWGEFVAPRAWTVQQQADAARMNPVTWRKGYRVLQAETVRALAGAMHRGLRRISYQVRDVSEKDLLERLNFDRKKG